MTCLLLLLLPPYSHLPVQVQVQVQLLGSVIEVSTKPLHFSVIYDFDIWIVYYMIERDNYIKHLYNLGIDRKRLARFSWRHTHRYGLQMKINSKPLSPIPKLHYPFTKYFSRPFLFLFSPFFFGDVPREPGGGDTYLTRSKPYLLSHISFFFLHLLPSFSLGLS